MILNEIRRLLSEISRKYEISLIATVQTTLGPYAGVASIESVSRRRIGSIHCVGSNAPFAHFFRLFFLRKKMDPTAGAEKRY